MNYRDTSALRSLLAKGNAKPVQLTRELEAFAGTAGRSRNEWTPLEDLARQLAEMISNRKRMGLDGLEALRRLTAMVVQARRYSFRDQEAQSLATNLVRLAQDEFPITLESFRLETVPPRSKPQGGLGLPLKATANIPVKSSTNQSDSKSHYSQHSNPPVSPLTSIGGPTPSIVSSDAGSPPRLPYVLTQHDLEHSAFDERDLQEYLGVGSNMLTHVHAAKLFETARTRVGATPQDAARVLLQAAKILYGRGASQDEVFITYLAYYAQFTGRRFQRESPRKDTSAAEYFLEAVRAMETHPLPLRGALSVTRRASMASILTSLIYLHDPRFNADRSNMYERPLRHVFIDSANSLENLYGKREGPLKFFALVRDVTIGLLRIRQINPNRLLEIVNTSHEVQNEMLRWIRHYSRLWFPQYQPTPRQGLSDLWGDLQRQLEEADGELEAKLASYQGLSQDNVDTLSVSLANELDPLPNHLHELDRSHLTNFRQFLRAVGEYYSAELFSFRRGSYEQARGLYERSRAEVRNNPTRLAVGHILAALHQGWKILEVDFATRKLQAQPRLKCFLLKDQVPLSIDPQGTKTVELQLKVANEGDDAAGEVQIDLSVDPTSAGASLVNTYRSLRTIEGRLSKVFTASIQLTRSFSSLVLIAELAYRYDGKPTILPPYHLEVRHSNPTDLTRLVDGTTPPYSLDAIDEPDKLRGRDDELRQLDVWLRSSSKSPVVIHGQRRVGKSSVGRVFSKQVWSAQNDYVVCYFEWLIYSNSPLWSILLGILEDQVVPRLLERMGNKRWPRPVPTMEEMQADPFGSFTRYLSAILQHRLVRTLLFVIDEFDAVAVTYQRGHIDRSFFLWLRGLMNMDGLRFVFLGGEGLPNILNEFGEDFNRSLPLHIDHLAVDAALELVQQPVTGYLKFSAASRSRIFDYCDGNPYYSTWLAIKILDVMHAKQEGSVSIIDVEQAVEQLFAKSMDQSKFVHLWHRDEVHYAVLRAVADTCHAQGQARSLFFTEYATINQIKQSISVKGLGDQTVHSALDVLEQRRVLRRKRVANSWAYRLRVGLFADWLIKHGALELRGIHDVNLAVWEGDGDVDPASVLLGEDS